MSIKLFSYQEKALEAILSDPCHSQLISMPTGTGKTITFLNAAKQIDKRCLIIVHREELLEQTHDKALKIGYLESEISIIKAQKKDPINKLSIAMVQTLVRNLDLYSSSEVEMMIVDEAHHSTANSYKEVFKHFQIFEEKKLLLGFTATPLRGDKDCLSSIYLSHSFKMTLSEATQNGYICPVHGVRIEIDKSLEKIENNGGDYKIDELDNIMNCDSINNLVAERCQHLNNVPALIFCTSVDHAERLAHLLRIKSRKAACVSYHTSKIDLEKTLTALKNGEMEFITNAVKLSEGFDYPPLQSIISVRPTRSPVLYKQMIGRGLRNSEGKYDCFVMEFCGNDPKMMSWEDIDNNATFQSFTESQKKSREEALGFYISRFKNPNIKITDVRISPFHFYECKITRMERCGKKYRYIPFTHGFLVGELRPPPYCCKSYEAESYLIYDYTCFWREQYKSFYVWDGGFPMGRSESINYGMSIKEAEICLKVYAYHQPEPLGKWYPSEEEPMTMKQKSYLKKSFPFSARKAEMFIEDCAIKQAIHKYWVERSMPDIDSQELDSGKITETIYELEGKY